MSSRSPECSAASRLYCSLGGGAYPASVWRSSGERSCALAPRGPRSSASMSRARDMADASDSMSAGSMPCTASGETYGLLSPDRQRRQ